MIETNQATPISPTCGVGAGAVEMSAVSDKVAYVKAQPQTRVHHCHWPGCDAQVPPAMWGCRKHWYSLPVNLRNAIWRSYRPGQEINATPSATYVAAARAAREWIKENYPDGVKA